MSTVCRGSALCRCLTDDDAGCGMSSPGVATVVDDDDDDDDDATVAGCDLLLLLLSFAGA
jgi:hypothetical protein